MMQRLGLACVALVAACHHGRGDAVCEPACTDGLVCRYESCVVEPTACESNAACTGDQHCDVAHRECLPWGVGPGGTSEPTCSAPSVAGVGLPTTRCAWLGPPAGDAYPDHVNVLATPMVAALAPGATPSIVFPAYNFTDDGGDACAGASPAHFAVIRIVDGQSCAQLATLASPTVVASAAVAVGDVGGDDAAPEIIAARSQGGLVAFTRRAAGWQVLWQTSSTLGDTQCDWAGPAIHDLDDDGKPEVLLLGAVYDGQTGAVIDESIAGLVDSTGVGYIPVVADLDGDGAPELVAGSQIYSWDKAARRWRAQRGLSGSNGLVGYGDLGTYPASGQDDRARPDGIAEVIVVATGAVRGFSAAGRLVFSAALRGGAAAGQGGPPTVADFDGDGRLEIGVAGQSAYQVLDPDCYAGASAASCASRSTDGVLWATAALGTPFTLAGSSAFDFDGDGRAEVVHADQCFARIYDGATGEVVASRARTSCGWFEYPAIADTDGAGGAELVIGSNRNASPPDCAVACPAVDPQFDGVACVEDTDCAAATRCVRERAGDPRGRCRCTRDPDCGEGYACVDPAAGPSPAGRVCRAARLGAPGTGVRVLTDAADRWASARPIWNQHAFSVAGIDPAGVVPRTSQWLRNWRQPTPVGFRVNAPADPAAALARADLTVRRAKVTCDAAGPTITAEVCNRGARAASAGLPVAAYTAATPSRLRCTAQTAAALAPGACEAVSCVWSGAPGDGVVVVDDRGDASGAARECREDNNTLAVRVACP